MVDFCGESNLGQKGKQRSMYSCKQKDWSYRKTNKQEIHLLWVVWRGNLLGSESWGKILPLDMDCHSLETETIVRWLTDFHHFTFYLQYDFWMTFSLPGPLLLPANEILGRQNEKKNKKIQLNNFRNIYKDITDSSDGINCCRVILLTVLPNWSSRTLSWWIPLQVWQFL